MTHTAEAKPDLITETLTNIDLTVRDYCLGQQSSGGRGLHAPTYLAIAATLAGEALRAGIDDHPIDGQLAPTKAFASGILSSFVHTLHQTSLDTKELPSFAELIQRGQQQSENKAGPILTASEHYKPQANLREAAATLRDDIAYIYDKAGLTPHERFFVTTSYLQKVSEQCAPALPAQQAYLLALEPFLAAALTPPMDKTSLPLTSALHFSQRIIDASLPLTQVLTAQNEIALGVHEVHPQTLLAKTGAIMGQVLHAATAATDNHEPPLVSPAATAFLKAGYDLLLNLPLYRIDPAPSLPDFSVYTNNATESQGLALAPRHHVTERNRPWTHAAAEASLAKEPIARIATEFKLSKGEIAAAVLVSAHKMILTYGPQTGTHPLVTLFMEEAVYASRVPPVELKPYQRPRNFDNFSQTPSPEESLAALRKAAAEAAMKYGY